MAKRMNELRMSVVAAQTGYQSTLDAVVVSDKPIVFSHTNCTVEQRAAKASDVTSLRRLFAGGGGF
jgi:microsomal dipeptidase-like Zn-dependent dipeptidase